MTSRSDAAAGGCFVYVTLPGEVDAVLAGRVEAAARSNGGTCRFVYGESYLARPNAVAIDPVELSRLDGETSARQNDLFGAIRDAGPDSWGRRLVERVAGSIPTEIGYLLWTCGGAGALSFGTGTAIPASGKPCDKILALPELQGIVDAVVSDDPDCGVARAGRLLYAGSAMGGARPKVVVEDDGALWIAKFGLKDDPYDICRLEKATLDLAVECGIDAAQSKVVTVAGRAVLMARRFDRDWSESGWHRHGKVSALTLLGAHEADRERWSYLLLADELRRVGKEAARDPRELFSRVVFNAVVNNDDDHPRNHAVMADGTGWRLSPAYDLVPRPALGGERRLAMSLGDGGRLASRANILSQCQRFLFGPDKASAEIDRIKSVVAQRWYPLCRDAGMTQTDCEKVRAAYLAESFEWNDGIARPGLY